MEDISPRKRYSSDLSARDWQRLKPLLRVRRRSKWPLVEVVNAVLYVLKNGCLWRDLPGDFPPWGRYIGISLSGSGRVSWTS
jgi:transposase